MSIDHHTEQLEAIRADFLKLWSDDLEPRAIALGATSKTLPVVADIAWRVFRHSKQPDYKP